jgi:hypothetical protein
MGNMEYQNSFVLSKEHLLECFDESQLLNALLTGKVPRPRYLLMVALTLVGFFFITFVQHNKMLGFFIIGLAFLEFFNFKYKRSWWITGQMWGKNSNNTIKLCFDDLAIKVSSLNVTLNINWDEIDHADETAKGYTLALKNKKRHYLSKLTLLPEMDALLISKVKIVQHFPT